MTNPRPATALALALALPFLAAQTALAERGVKEVHEVVPLDADGTVTIKTFKGSITVTTGTASEVRIDARIEPDGDHADQRRKVEETRVDIRGKGSAVTIESDYDDVKRRQGLWGFSWGGDHTLPFVRYTITLPRTARLIVDDYKSQISIAGLASRLDLETYKGTVRIKDLEGPARLETYKGDVRIEMAALSGDVELQTYKGDVELSIPAASRFTLDADTGRRGSFTSDFTMAAQTTSRGSRRRRDDGERFFGDVNGGGARVEMETYKGSLRLRQR